MRILFTNNTLSQPAGTELAVRDLCLGLRDRGHEVVAYSPQHGRVAAELREAGVRVCDELGGLDFQPEVIHGQHEWETGLAAMRWPECPVISFCRGMDAWQEAPCLAPNVVFWVAVDESCRSRLLATPGVRADAVRVVLNGIRLERCERRGALPERPSKALVFSNYAMEDNFGGVLKAACQEMGMECELAGAGSGHVLSDPGRVLGRYDVVFAKGKAALEALACGCGVIVADERGLGPLVGLANYDWLRKESFGFRCMTEPVSAAGLRERLEGWQKDDAMVVVDRVRAEAGWERMLEEVEALHAEAAQRRPLVDAAEWPGFAAAFAESKGVFYKLGREIWETGRKAQVVEELPGSGEERERGFNRLLDRFRKGLKAIQEVKKSTSKPKQGMERKRRGIWPFGGGKA